MYKKVIDQNHEQWKLQPDARLDIIDGSNYPALYTILSCTDDVKIVFLLYRNHGWNLINNINTYTEYENEHNFTKYNLDYVYNNH